MHAYVYVLCMYYVLWSCVAMYVVLHLLQQFYMVSMLSHANGLNDDISKCGISRVAIMLSIPNKWFECRHLEVGHITRVFAAVLILTPSP